MKGKERGWEGRRERQREAWERSGGNNIRRCVSPSAGGRSCPKLLNAHRLKIFKCWGRKSDGTTGRLEGKGWTGHRRGRG